MSFSRQTKDFTYQRFNQSTEGYNDYYGVTMTRAKGGFPAGSRFDALSVRHDGAVHARAGASTYYLGREQPENGRYQQHESYSRGTASPRRAQRMSAHHDDYEQHGSRLSAYGYHTDDHHAQGYHARSPRAAQTYQARSPRAGYQRHGQAYHANSYNNCGASSCSMRR